MFTEALFTITMKFIPPRCPPTDEWIMKIPYIYTMNFYSAIRKNETFGNINESGNYYI